MSSIPKLHQIDRIEGYDGKVVQVIKYVAARWEEVATRLHFESHDISRINGDNHYKNIPCCRKMFGEWLDGNGREPVNWETLITALKEAGFSQLASDLQNIICGT